MIVKTVKSAFKAFNSMIFHKPFFSILYLTYRCNSKCRYCDIYTRKSKELSVSQWKNILLQLHDAGVSFISLTGGEPLLYNGIEEVLYQAQKLSMHTTLITNGLLFKNKINNMEGLIDDLIFSLSTVNEEKYTAERGVKGLDKVLSAVDCARNAKMNPSILATVDNESIEELEELADWCNKEGLLLIPGPVYEYYKNIPLNKDYINRIENILDGNSNIWMNRAFVKFIKEGGNNLDNPRCSASNTVVINPEGSLLVPCFHRCYKNYSGIINNSSYKNNFKDIWKESKQLRKKAGKYYFCKGCTILCYFEGGFIFPLSSYTILDIISRLTWLYKQWDLTKII